jgi:hypothetical protein
MNATNGKKQAAKTILAISSLLFAAAGLILYLFLPQVKMVFPANGSDPETITETINPRLFFLGIGQYDFFVNSTSGIRTLLIKDGAFNFFGLLCFLIGFSSIVVAILSRSGVIKKKTNLLIDLLFAFCIVMILSGPTFFMISNGLGNANTATMLNLADYWLYDGFEMKLAYGGYLAAGFLILALLLLIADQALEEKNNEQE